MNDIHHQSLQSLNNFQLVFLPTVMTGEFSNMAVQWWAVRGPVVWPSLPAAEWLNVNQSLRSIMQRSTFSNWHSSAICRPLVRLSSPNPPSSLPLHLQSIRIWRQGKASLTPLKWDCQSQGCMLSRRFGARLRECATWDKRTNHRKP